MPANTVGCRSAAGFIQPVFRYQAGVTGSKYTNRHGIAACNAAVICGKLQDIITCCRKCCGGIEYRCAGRKCYCAGTAVLCPQVRHRSRRTGQTIIGCRGIHHRAGGAGCQPDILFRACIHNRGLVGIKLPLTAGCYNCVVYAVNTPVIDWVRSPTGAAK